MKQTKSQNEFLPLKQFVLFFSVILGMLLMSGITSAAAEQTLETTNDYSSKIVEKSSGCEIVFTPITSIEWVILHYKVNDTDNSLLYTNPLMEKYDQDFTYTISDVNKGDSITVCFTYKYLSGLECTSNPVTYTVGSASEDPIRIEAEDFSSMSGIQTDGTEISGLDTNDWIRYSKETIPTTGSYRIIVRGKTDGSRDGMLVFRDASQRITTMIISNSSDYTEYKSRDIVSDIKLPLTVIAVSGRITMDWLAFEPADDAGDNNSEGDNDNSGDNSTQEEDNNSGDSSTQEEDNNSGDNSTQEEDNTSSGNGNPDVGGNTGDLEVEQPEADTTIEKKEDKMIFQFNNKTEGAYSDEQIYWCALGYDPVDMKLCYVTANGDLEKADASLNDTNLPNGRKAATQIVNTLADNKYVYMPSIVSGRMYISYGKPIYIEINTDANGNTGFAGPDMNNPNDPNAETYFEFMEFTIGLYGGAVDEPVHYWGNTTRVDNYCFPVVSRLIGENRGYDEAGNVVSTTPYDKTVGDVGGRDDIFKEFIEKAPEEFKGLSDNYRIFAPCKKTFNEGQENEHYFDATIEAFWEKYSNETFELHCEGGDFEAHTEGDVLYFTDTRTGSTGVIYKPTTQDVLEGRGNFDHRTQAGLPGDLELVLEAQLCAAFNRGLALQPTSEWYTVANYYKYTPNNYYAGFWHDHSVGSVAYGFCYDDVNDQSTLLECNTAQMLVMNLLWN